MTGRSKLASQAERVLRWRRFPIALQSPLLLIAASALFADFRPVQRGEQFLSAL